ncbi:MAG TPA: FixH family protein [Bradyrhizobium sp.]|nr:FixH family protein [Bradyrhizobium sp.]
MSPRPSQRQLTGRTVLVILLVFFGVVIGVNVTMARLAISTLPGTEVDSPYSASLAYEKEIAAAHSQEARHWEVDAHVERAADGAALLQLTARDKDGRPVSGLKFEGRLERPTDKRADQAIELSEVGIGVYRGRLDAVAAGQWDLVLEGDRAGQRMFLSKNRVILN